MKPTKPDVQPRHGLGVTDSRPSWVVLVVAAALAVSALVAPRPARADDPTNLIERQTLDNGLEIIVIPDPSLPITTVEMAVRNGAMTETPELNGLSHLYEHMFFKANAVIPNQQAYLDRLRELGIVFNGSTSTERVNYFFTLPSENFEAGLQFMYDAITSTKFDKKEFSKEKQVVIGEIDRNESNPYYWFNQAIKDKLWPKYPSRKDALGDRDTVSAATVDQMKTMKQRYYVPNNSALIIAGDVEPKRAFEVAQKLYKKWKRAPDPFKKRPVPQQPALTKSSYMTVKRDVKVPSIQFSWHGPSIPDDPTATYAADVLSFILGQETSTFQKRLVESGLTLSAGLSYYTQAHTGPINLSAQVRPQNLKKAVRGLLEETHKLADPAYFSDEQLENAKTILAVRDVYDREKTSSFAHTVSFWWTTAGLQYYLDYVPNLKEVTRQDIADYVDDYIIDQPYVMGVLLSADQKKKLGLTDKDLAEMVRQIEDDIADADASTSADAATDDAATDDAAAANNAAANSAAANSAAANHAATNHAATNHAATNKPEASGDSNDQ